jgi:hypothetical protein
MNDPALSHAKIARSRLRAANVQGTNRAEKSFDENRA